MSTSSKLQPGLIKGKLYKISKKTLAKNNKYELVAYGLFLDQRDMPEKYITVYSFWISGKVQEFWGSLSPYIFEEVK